MSVFDNVDILLVEDNRQDAELTMRALLKADFHEKVCWVQDGVEALEFMSCTAAFEGRDPHRRPKLVLLDLKMPRLDGLDVARALKSAEETRSIPIVVMTSSNQPRDIAESYELGVNGYVTKPIQSKDLEAAVTGIAVYWLRLNEVR
jgi:two-component system response regulator